MTGEAAPPAAHAALMPEDGFCQLFGANLSRDSQCLDDWRLQFLELLPAAKLQLTEAQVTLSDLLLLVMANRDIKHHMMWCWKTYCLAG